MTPRSITQPQGAVIRILPRDIIWSKAPFVAGDFVWHRGSLGIVDPEPVMLDDGKVDMTRLNLQLCKATGEYMETQVSDERIVVLKSDLQPAGFHDRIRLVFGG